MALRFRLLVWLARVWSPSYTPLPHFDSPISIKSYCRVIYGVSIVSFVGGGIVGVLTTLRLRALFA